MGATGGTGAVGDMGTVGETGVVNETGAVVGTGAVGDMGTMGETGAVDGTVALGGRESFGSQWALFNVYRHLALGGWSGEVRTGSGRKREELVVGRYGWYKGMMRDGSVVGRGRPGRRRMGGAGLLYVGFFG